MKQESTLMQMLQESLSNGGSSRIKFSTTTEPAHLLETSEKKNMRVHRPLSGTLVFRFLPSGENLKKLAG